MNAGVIEFVIPVALKDVFDALAPEFIADTGYRFELALMLNPEVPGYIAQGNPWSIAASNPPYIQKVIASGGCDPTLYHLGHSPLALVVKGQSDHAPAQSRDDIATVLKSAKTIAITDGGTSGSQFRQLVATLGLQDTLTAQVIHLPGGGPLAAVLDGRADMAALPLTNIAPINGVSSAAICPADLGVHVDLSFCVRADANPATRAFADWLVHPNRTAAFQRLGLVPADRDQGKGPHTRSD